MSKLIDAKGLACPKPVILAKKAIEDGQDDFKVEVDNDTAVGNLTRLAGSSGYSITADKENPYLLTFAKGSGGPAVGGAPAGQESGAGTEAAAGAAEGSVGRDGGWALFCGTDILGDGDRQLGGNLIRMYFYTLSQAEKKPAAVIFVNSGVKLPTQDQQVIEHLKVLQEKGCRVLACGTCLDFYGLKEQLQVGQVSNMYDIITCLGEYSKVVSLG